MSNVVWALGAELFDAVTGTITLIQSHPEAGALRRGRFVSRQLNVRRFPYKVVYRVREDHIYVIAIAHARRRPGYWRGRH
jgi:toxin ParE1/3/4